MNCVPVHLCRADVLGVIFSLLVFAVLGAVLATVGVWLLAVWVGL